MRRWNLVLGVLFVLALGVTAALAVAPATSHDGEVPLPLGMVAPAFRQLDATEASRTLPGWESFTASTGKGWMVSQYRDDLGTPTSIFGPGIQLTTDRASGAELGQVARDFVSAHASMLKADANGLGTAEVNPLDATRTQVILRQSYRGLEVVGGRVEVFLDGGKVVLLGSEYYPGINLEVVPALSAKRAQGAAIGGVNFSAVTDAFVGEPRLVIFPLVLDGRPSYFLAWEVKFTTVAPDAYWWTYVDASDGEILGRQNLASTLDIPTTVKTDIQENYSYDPMVEVTSPDHLVKVNALNYYTDASGFVNLPVATGDPYAVSSEIRGKYCNVNRYTGEGVDATWSGNGMAGTPLTVKWDNTNSLASERDAYYSVQRVHQWLKDHDPSFTAMDTPMTTIVNRTDGTCNAYWNGSSINFYKEGGGCSNMATISDVVMHEYGHAITERTYTPDSPPTGSGMGEALADIVAQTITNDRYMGRGWQNGGGYIRDGENNRLYPGSECGGEVHCLGEILMGSMWRARTNILSSMGSGPGLAHYDAMMRFAWKTKTQTMPTYLTKVLLGDDNNANLADGTPHWDDICTAFASHNLPCPAITQYIVFNHTPQSDANVVDEPVTVVAGIGAIACGDLVADSLRVYYSTDFGATWGFTLLLPTGTPDEFSGDIPPQPCGTVVSYYLRAASTTGVIGLFPDHAPARSTFQYMVGPRTVVLNDNFEANLGWTVGAPGDAATDGIWERVDPVGKTLAGVVYQPEDDHTAAPGTLCYVTKGTGGYYLDGDVDGGATTILSPVYDFSAASGGCKVDFFAFFQNQITPDDTLRASVSSDNGTHWKDLVKIRGTGLNAWNYYKVYFTSDQVPFTSQMRFRFQVADYNGSQTEAAVDDILIRRNTCAGSTDVADGETLPARFAVEAARPNPTNGGTALRFALPAAGTVGVDLYDASGRVVRTLARGPMAAGFHTVNWDGQDSAGHPVASGVYYYQVRANGEQQTRKVLVVR